MHKLTNQPTNKQTWNTQSNLRPPGKNKVWTPREVWEAGSGLDTTVILLEGCGEKLFEVGILEPYI